MTAPTEHHLRNEKQARLDGQLAAIRGQFPTENPHPLGTSESRQWARGWREVKEPLHA